MLFEVVLHSLNGLFDLDDVRCGRVLQLAERAEISLTAGQGAGG